MISISISHIIFPIFFTTIIGTSNVKILQISEPICDNKNCILSQEKGLKNALNFISKKGPDIILWFRKNQSNETLFENITNTSMPKTITVPVYNSNTTARYYHSSPSSYNVSLVVLNTALWLNGNSNAFANQQIQWLNSTLRDFKRKEKKVIIVGFDAPGSLETSSSGSTKYVPVYNRMIVELLQTYSSTIGACIFGGEEMDSFRIVMDDKGRPAIPMFMSSNVAFTSPSARLYLYNSKHSTIDNYVQYTDIFSNNPTVEYNYTDIYSTKTTDAKQLYQLADSFLQDKQSVAFTRYNLYQLHGVSFSVHCAQTQDQQTCAKCCARCFIVNLIETNISRCLQQCSVLEMVNSLLTPTGKSIVNNNNNNVFCILGVIIGFVVILVGIVLAVNKVYCLRFNRQRNVFLAPLILDISDDVKLSSSIDNVSIVVCPSKVNGISNGGGKRGSLSTEQTYDYIRM